ncbi:MAG: hypothetical protein US76_03365 [Parcubacteria group bacterium GW2011_GWA2_38_13b]|nr:MAG: hypothetical protein US76_03365 [Parcubacteria group bacterium GW2011_GWA2_38_13b]
MKNKTEIEHIEGSSTSYGFGIKIKLENRCQDIRLSTKSCDHYPLAGKFLRSFIFCFIAASFFCLPAIFLLELILGGSGFVYYLGFFTIFVSFSSFWELFWILIDRDKREWHICERKVISLLLSGVSVTMDNLRKAPKENIGCGTIGGLGRSFLCFYYLSLAAVHKYFFSFYSAEFWLIWIFVSTLYCILICAAVSFLDRKFFTIPESSFNKLKETLELAQEAEKIIKIG